MQKRFVLKSFTNQIRLFYPPNISKYCTLNLISSQKTLISKYKIIISNEKTLHKIKTLHKKQGFNILLVVKQQKKVMKNNKFWSQQTDDSNLFLNKYRHFSSQQQATRKAYDQKSGIRLKQPDIPIDNDTHLQFRQQKIQQEQENLIESIIPISHSKRQKSLSPIKKQSSIGSQKYFHIQSPKVNLTSTFTAIPFYQYDKKKKGQNISQFYLANGAQSQRVDYSSSYKVDEKIFLSKKKNKSRKTQIFSSDKKQKEKSLTINRNIIAEQILNLNKKQRLTQNNQIKQQQKQQKQHNKEPSRQFLKNQRSSYLKKNNKQTLQLQKSRELQLQKLNQYQSSSKLIEKQYWQSIYPQSKKYINELIQILDKDYQVLTNWKEQIQLALRENLYKVEEIVLQQLYKICRASIKIWIQNQLGKIEEFQKDNFSLILSMKEEIQRRKKQLKNIDNSLECLKNSRQNRSNNNQFNVNSIQKKIFSRQYSFQVSQMSKKVKAIIQNTQEKASLYCKHKLSKANLFSQTQQQQCLSQFQDTKIQNLQKVILQRLENTFLPHKKVIQPIIANNNNLPQTKQEQNPRIKLNQIKKLLSKQLQKQKVIITSNRNPIFKDQDNRSYSRDHSSISQKKSTSNSIIKDSQKVFKQFKTQFQSRRKNFIAKNLPSLVPSSQKNYAKFYESQSQNDNEHDYQRPISQKLYQNNNKQDERFKGILINTRNQFDQQAQKQQLTYNKTKKFDGPGGMSRFNLKSGKHSDNKLHRYSIQ